jgi:hypothetical protein
MDLSTKLIINEQLFALKKVQRIKKRKTQQKAGLKMKTFWEASK